MLLFTTPGLAAKPGPKPPKPPRRWPALAAAWYLGALCSVAGAAVVWNIAAGATTADNRNVLLAIGLRLFTVAMAVASITSLGRMLPRAVLLTGLWGAAVLQLIYPLAQTGMKTLVLVGVMDPAATGWHGFATSWLIWGIPGVLFALTAVSYGRLVPAQRR